MSKLIVILGPTATGKTKLAVKLTKLFNGEIISADSRQIYQDMDIGTAKNLKEYQEIPYHLINIIKPTAHFNVAEFKKKAEKAIADIISRGKTPFLVGGTGLYISALIENYQFPAQAKPKYNILQLGLKLPKKELNKKIDARVDKMIKNGLIEETKKLIKKYPPAALRLTIRAGNKKIPPLRAIGYAEITDYLNKKTAIDEAVQLIKTHTHQFAKRQMTWFRKDKKIIWLKNYSQAKKIVKKFLN